MRSNSGLVSGLRAARLRRGLSQAEVATRAGTTQSAIARFEAGVADPRLSTAQRYADAVGVDLEARAVCERTLKRTATQVKASLAEDDSGEALRHVIQFLDDIAGRDAADVRAAIHIEPDGVGNPRWDALLAGIAEYVAHRADLPVPGWASAPGRVLNRFWFVIDDILGRSAPGLDIAAFVSAPPELANRGVFLDRSSLVSV